ncbi:MAG: NADH-quinone oxidoreductase subunit N [Planctomycetales bacterium]|nr:NADH-quinone oxidoreductase subunit N [bacterium]UNM08055.1 MAG: NADH-quinone oxidoreductase subunit N [Planctomycetales bacterium]
MILALQSTLEAGHLQALDRSLMIALAPVVILTIAVLVLLLVDYFGRKHPGPQGGISLQNASTITIASTVLALLGTLGTWGWLNTLPNGPSQGLFPSMIPSASAARWDFAPAFVVDHFFLFVCLLVCVVVIITSLNFIPFLQRKERYHAELFPLLLLSAIGMMLITGSRDLITTFMSLELLSLPLYVMCGLNDKNRLNKESSLKYFLMGAFASGFFVFGAALIYGMAGHLNYTVIQNMIAETAQSVDPVMLIGIGLVGVGIAFKLGMVPFHAWVPDVYQGAPTPVTAFMATGVKVAMFAAATRIVLECLPGLQAELWRDALVLFACLSMLVGNLFALHQMSAKRLLAFSAIAHTGYLALGMVSGTPASGSAVLFYLAGYTFASLGAFLLITWMAPDGQDDVFLDQMHELWQKAPKAAICLTILLLSMGGFPLTAGFFGKFVVFKEAWLAGLSSIVIFALLNSAVSFYYYLRFVIAMYMTPAVPGEASLNPRQMPGGYVFSMVMTVGLTIILGVLPQLLLGALDLTNLGS